MIIDASFTPIMHEMTKSSAEPSIGKLIMAFGIVLIFLAIYFGFKKGNKL